MRKTIQYEAPLSIRPFFSRALFGITLFWLFVGLSNTTLTAKPQSTVLAIYAGRSDMPANILVDRTIRSTLVDYFDVGLDYRSEYIESPLPPESSPALRDYLRSKYLGTRFDVIVAVANDAVHFIRDYGQELFPGVPFVIFGGRDQIENWGDGPPVTGVLDPKRTGSMKTALDFILTLQPEIREVFVVSGTEPWDRTREALAREEIGGNPHGVRVTFLASLVLEDLEKRVASLPKGSVVFYLTMREDAAGKKFVTSDILNEIARIASVPVYTVSAAQIGSGIVASLVTDQESMARETAEIIQRVLRGELVKDIPIRGSRLTRVVDWRQLRRWNISEDRVPAGTSVRFKEPGIWDLYKWHIAAVISLCIVQALLILAFLVQNARRKRAEAAATGNRELLQSAINALDAHVALLDAKANIVAVNENWRRFAAANGYVGADCGVGRNYLEICDSSVACPDADSVSRAIRDLVNGDRDDFCFVYECSYGANECWFQLRAKRFLSQRVLWVALAHENVTDIKRAHNTQQHLSGMLLRAQDDERRRIARDLHDVTVQNMTALKADLTRVHYTSNSLEVVAQEALGESMSLCDQVIKELRTLSYLLHPPLLDEVGLVAAIQWYVRGFIERSGVKVQIVVRHEIGRLPSDTETALFRVVQESLTNIHRHSGSHSAILWVRKEEDGVVVRVQDYGRGMTESPADSPQTGQLPGVGLLGMRQRLTQLGGRLDIESDSNGTTITARVPMLRESYAAHSYSR